MYLLLEKNYQLFSSLCEKSTFFRVYFDILLYFLEYSVYKESNRETISSHYEIRRCGLTYTKLGKDIMIQIQLLVSNFIIYSASNVGEGVEN
jgi:hypothetical protein